MSEMRGVTWFVFWRFAILAFLAGLLSGGVFGFVVGLVGAFSGSPEVARPVASIGGAVLGLIASFIVLNWVLARAVGRPIGGRELRLVVVS